MNPPLHRLDTGQRILDRLRRLRSRWCPTTRERVVAACGDTILAGPFRGMRYVDRAVGSALPPKLLGTYELELHPWLEEIIGTDYREIRVVGCAEGYYAVGLARRLPGCRVLAHDLDRSVPHLLKRLAVINEVADRVEFRGELSAASVASEPAGRTLIVCDIEGAEAELLDPVAMPLLRRSDILVEVHDAAKGTIETILRERFAATHRIRRAIAIPRTLGDIEVPLQRRFRRRTLERSIDEGRKYGLTWLFMTTDETAT